MAPYSAPKPMSWTRWIPPSSVSNQAKTTAAPNSPPKEAAAKSPARTLKAIRSAFEPGAATPGAPAGGSPPSIPDLLPSGRRGTHDETRVNDVSRHHTGAPGRNRTCDTRFRKPLLYPLSYEGEGWRNDGGKLAVRPPASRNEVQVQGQVQIPSSRTAEQAGFTGWGRRGAGLRRSSPYV